MWAAAHGNKNENHMRKCQMHGVDFVENFEEQREKELEEAEQMVRNGASVRRILRKQFRTLGQSDIYKIYRKFGMSPEEPEY